MNLSPQYRSVRRRTTIARHLIEETPHQIVKRD
jgi:hypothetical protein